VLSTRRAYSLVAIKVTASLVISVLALTSPAFSIALSSALDTRDIEYPKDEAPSWREVKLGKTLFCVEKDAPSVIESILKRVGKNRYFVYGGSVLKIP
jgi:hypothetical protein